MAFGFDASLILGASKANEGSIGDTLQQLAQIKASQAQQQHAQATLADMLRKQGQEQTLADIFRSNADKPEGLAPALMRGGFGAQAFAAQDQASQMAQQEAMRGKMLRDAQDAHRKHVGELFWGANTPEKYAAARQELAASSDPMLAVYASKIPEAFDPGVAERLGNLAMTAKERSDIQQKGLDRTNHTENAKIAASARPQMLVVGDDGTQYLQPPSRPDAPAKPIRDEAGNPIRKPPTAGSGGGAKDWKDLTTALSTGARGSLTKDIQKSLNSAEALQTLLQMPDGSLVNASPQQMREAYTALNNLIAKGGSQAVSQIEHLAPETMASKFASAKQYLLNEPQGANAQEFIKNILDTASREAKLARKQMRAQQLQSLPNYAHLRKTDPARFESILKGVGIDPSGIDENGLEAAPTSKGGLTKEEAAELAELEKKYGAKK